MIEIKVPVLPESVADAVVAAWSKAEGESIRQDENLVDLETDKVILEVPSTADGVLKEICFQQGDTVTAGQVLARIEECEVASVEQTESQKQGEAQDASMSPSVRKLMEANQLTAADIKGSGRGGRILKEDVEQFLNKNSVSQSKNEAEETPSSVKVAVATATQTRALAETTGHRIEKRVPMTRLRAKIAERLVQAQQNAAILTTFNEVNMQPVMSLRKKYRDIFEKEHGVRLGFMSFFVKASIEALKRFPEVNASIDGNDVVYHGFFDIGVAVSGKNGLVVPVLRDADMLSIADVEKQILDYGQKAQSNSLSIEEITGGTFTISNGGVFGSMLSTPILNPPQSAILGMHSIKERAMVVDGEIKILPMMYLALSYDHRIIDGREAVQFLVTIKDMLEDPSRMMLGV